MDRVTVFGAGHVGSTTAFYLALSAALEVVLIDSEEGKAEGLALDIGQALPYTGSGAKVEGGSSPELAAGSDLVIITAGFPRLPGMSRLDLTSKNVPIVASIAVDVARLAPEAILMVVTNPVDEMTHLAWKRSGLPARRVMGMAGVLDTSRFLYFLERTSGFVPGETTALVLGTHGDDMVPLTDWSKAGGRSLARAVGPGLDGLVERTRDAGAEIVGHLKTGSAYFAPAVSCAVMGLAILGDSGRVLPASAYLQGEYGISGVFLGVPASLGRVGVKEVLELDLSETERKALSRSAEGVTRRISELEAYIEDEDD